MEMDFNCNPDDFLKIFITTYTYMLYPRIEDRETRKYFYNKYWVSIFEKNGLINEINSTPEMLISLMRYTEEADIKENCEGLIAGDILLNLITMKNSGYEKCSVNKAVAMTMEFYCKRAVNQSDKGFKKKYSRNSVMGIWGNYKKSAHMWSSHLLLAEGFIDINLMKTNPLVIFSVMDELYKESQFQEIEGQYYFPDGHNFPKIHYGRFELSDEQNEFLKNYKSNRYVT